VSKSVAQLTGCRLDLGQAGGIHCFADRHPKRREGYLPANNRGRNPK
jgi:hypothetical protein